MARTQKAFCNICGEESKLLHRIIINADLGFLTFRCLNPECEQEFVLQLEYSHSTKPSKLKRKPNDTTTN